MPTMEIPSDDNWIQYINTVRAIVIAFLLSSIFIPFKGNEVDIVHDNKSIHLYQLTYWSFNWSGLLLKLLSNNSIAVMCSFHNQI